MSLKQKHLIWFCICAITSFIWIALGIWRLSGVDDGIKYLLQGAEIGIYCLLVPEGPWH